MIACELVAAAAAASVPLAWLLGGLNVTWLIIVALIIGTAGVMFRAANFPHIAAVVPPEQRTDAMAGFNASYSVASVSGPGLAGLLVQTLTAPFAVLAEALSFLASALLLRAIRTPEKNEPPLPRHVARRRGGAACQRHPSGPARPAGRRRDHQLLRHGVHGCVHALHAEDPGHPSVDDRHTHRAQRPRRPAGRLVHRPPGQAVRREPDPARLRAVLSHRDPGGRPPGRDRSGGSSRSSP